MTTHVLIHIAGLLMLHGVSTLTFIDPRQGSRMVADEHSVHEGDPVSPKSTAIFEVENYTAFLPEFKDIQKSTVSYPQISRAVHMYGHSRIRNRFEQRSSSDSDYKIVKASVVEEQSAHQPVISTVSKRLPYKHDRASEMDARAQFSTPLSKRQRRHVDPDYSTGLAEYTLSQGASADCANCVHHSIDYSSMIQPKSGGIEHTNTAMRNARIGSIISMTVSDNGANVPETTDGQGTVLSPEQIPGQPLVDYPVLVQVPHSKFDCADVETDGFYADSSKDSGCQAFWVCHNHDKVGFLCPNGTLFNQRYLKCDWWFNVKCQDATQSYHVNKHVNVITMPVHSLDAGVSFGTSLQWRPENTMMSEILRYPAIPALFPTGGQVKRPLPGPASERPVMIPGKESSDDLSGPDASSILITGGLPATWSSRTSGMRARAPEFINTQGIDVMGSQQERRRRESVRPSVDVKRHVYLPRVSKRVRSNHGPDVESPNVRGELQQFMRENIGAGLQSAIPSLPSHSGSGSIPLGLLSVVEEQDKVYFPVENKKGVLPQLQSVLNLQEAGPDSIKSASIQDISASHFSQPGALKVLAASGRQVPFNTYVAPQAPPEPASRGSPLKQNAAQRTGTLQNTPNLDDKTQYTGLSLSDSIYLTQPGGDSKSNLHSEHRAPPPPPLPAQVSRNRNCPDGCTSPPVSAQNVDGDVAFQSQRQNGNSHLTAPAEMALSVSSMSGAHSPSVASKAPTASGQSGLAPGDMDIGNHLTQVSIDESLSEVFNKQPHLTSYAVTAPPVSSESDLQNKSLVQGVQLVVSQFPDPPHSSLKEQIPHPVRESAVQSAGDSLKTTVNVTSKDDSAGGAAVSGGQPAEPPQSNTEGKLNTTSVIDTQVSDGKDEEIMEEKMKTQVLVPYSIEPEQKSPKKPKRPSFTSKQGVVLTNENNKETVFAGMDMSKDIQSSDRGTLPSKDKPKEDRSANNEVVHGMNYDKSLAPHHAPSGMSLNLNAQLMPEESPSDVNVTHDSMSMMDAEGTVIRQPASSMLTKKLNSQAKIENNDRRRPNTFLAHTQVEQHQLGNIPALISDIEDPSALTREMPSERMKGEPPPIRKQPQLGQIKPGKKAIQITSESVSRIIKNPSRHRSIIKDPSGIDRQEFMKPPGLRIRNFDSDEKTTTEKARLEPIRSHVVGEIDLDPSLSKRKGSSKVVRSTIEPEPGMNINMVAESNANLGGIPSAQPQVQRPAQLRMQNQVQYQPQMDGDFFATLRGALDRDNAISDFAPWNGNPASIATNLSRRPQVNVLESSVAAPAVAHSPERPAAIPYRNGNTGNGNPGSIAVNVNRRPQANVQSSVAAPAVAPSPPSNGAIPPADAVAKAVVSKFERDFSSQLDTALKAIDQILGPPPFKSKRNLNSDNTHSKRKSYSSSLFLGDRPARSSEDDHNNSDFDINLTLYVSPNKGTTSETPKKEKDVVAEVLEKSSSQEENGNEIDISLDSKDSPSVKKSPRIAAKAGPQKPDSEKKVKVLDIFEITAPAETKDEKAAHKQNLHDSENDSDYDYDIKQLPGWMRNAIKAHISGVHNHTNSSTNSTGGEEHIQSIIKIVQSPGRSVRELSPAGKSVKLCKNCHSYVKGRIRANTPSKQPVRRVFHRRENNLDDELDRLPSKVDSVSAPQQPRIGVGLRRLKGQRHTGLVSKNRLSRIML